MKVRFPYLFLGAIVIVVACTVPLVFFFQLDLVNSTQDQLNFLYRQNQELHFSTKAATIASAL